MPKPESWNKRQLIWRHNGFKGSAVMIQKMCNSMLKSKTTTEESKSYAAKIQVLATNLEQSLQKRVGP